MVFEDVSRFQNAASGKVKLLKEHPMKYMLRAVVAGFFIGTAMIFSNVVNVTFKGSFPEWGKLLSGLVFAIAVILIVFMGGELFTGNNFVMAFAYYGKSVKIKDVLKVWAASYIGNFLGCVIITSLFVLAGGSGTRELYAPMADAKLGLPLLEMFFKAILCNFFVCIAVASGTKCKEDISKIVIIFLCITAFVMSGFEHCIANMANFTAIVFYVPGVSILQILRSMLVVTIGNMIGGGILLALPLRKMSDENNKEKSKDNNKEIAT